MTSAAVSQSSATRFFESEIITLLVGELEFPFRVHKDLLVESGSKFFTACLSNFVERGIKTIRLPEEDITPVRMFVDWLYRGRKLEDSSYHLERWHKSGLIYAFADEILAEDYCNHIMDCIRYDCRLANKSFHPKSLIAKKHGLTRTPFYRFALKSVVAHVMKRHSRYKTDGEKPTMLNDIYGDKEIMQDFTQEILAYVGENYVNPRLWEGCHFHEHKEGTTCSAASP